MTPPVAFGYKMSWLAIRSTEPHAAVEALEIEGPTSTPWAEAVEAVYALDAVAHRPVFVTPPIDGWVLVASPAFFDEISDTEPARMGRFVAGIARKLDTEVQLFGTHRVVEGHAWARADSEGLARAYAYLGEIGACLLDEGERTSVERDLELVTAKAAEAGAAALDGEIDPPGEETVMRVAAAWSLDPTRLEDDHPDMGDGWLGRLGGSGAAPTDGGPAAKAPHRPWWKFW